MASQLQDQGNQESVDLAAVLDGLNDLLRLDHDAIGSYELAIESLLTEDYAVQIDRFRDDHESHIRRLNEVIVELGGTPANEPHPTAPLKQAMQNLGGAGGEKGVLLAWRANELQSKNTYERYRRASDSWPREARQVIAENALDEERHYAWVRAVLGDEDPRDHHRSSSLAEGARWLLARGKDEITLAVRKKTGRTLLKVLVGGFIIGRFLR